MIRLVLTLVAAAALSTASWVLSPTASLAQTPPSCDAGGPSGDCSPEDYESNGGGGGTGNSDADGSGSSTGENGGSEPSGGDDPGSVD